MVCFEVFNKGATTWAGHILTSLDHRPLNRNEELHLRQFSNEYIYIGVQYTDKV